MNMNKWFEELIASDKKAALPILSFPAAKMLGVTVDELVNSGDLQAQGVKLMTDAYPVAAAQAYMNLSAEAEAFGAKCVHSPEEVPTIIGQLVATPEDADALELPAIGTKQTGPILDGLKKARALITDKPFFAECIGPFSLAGRLMDVNEIMVNCYDEPEMVETIMQKTTKYLIGWMGECKKAGCDGVIMAEPLTGVLSPNLAREFSHPYVKELVDQLKKTNNVIFVGCVGKVRHHYKYGDYTQVLEMETIAELPNELAREWEIKDAKTN